MLGVMQEANASTNGRIFRVLNELKVPFMSRCLLPVSKQVRYAIHFCCRITGPGRFQHIGHPILGDIKYQNDQSHAVTATAGLKRLFLHAKAIAFELAGEHYELECSLDAELESVLRHLRGQR